MSASWLGVVAALCAAACSKSSPSTPLQVDAPAEACPASVPDHGTSCAAAARSCSYPNGSAYPSVCTCGGSPAAWSCSTCPAGSAENDPSNYECTGCTRGTSCEFDDFEDGCQCTCGSAGTWTCRSIEGVISCPCGPGDAGV